MQTDDSHGRVRFAAEGRRRVLGGILGATKANTPPLFMHVDQINHRVRCFLPACVPAWGPSFVFS